MSRSPSRPWLFASLLLGSALVSPLICRAEPLDVLTLKHTRGMAGRRVSVPVFVLDAGYTPLGRDQLAGSKIQGFSLRVIATPASAVVSLSLVRAGITATPVPLWETVKTYGNTLTWMAVFNAFPDVLPFDLDRPLPGDRVATLKVRLKAGLPPGTIVRLQVDPEQTLLSSQAGSVTETAHAGTLLLKNGRIIVTGGF